LQIPSALIYQTSEPDEINCVPNADVDYIPDTDLFYAVYYQYYRYLLRFGANTPLPELVFGILAHETNFLWVLGDNGDSIGPCQLHVQTAKWLYRNEFKELFSKFFYFDRNGKHHFYTQESMVAFVFEFLLQVKGYRQGREQAAIAAYNGCEIGSPYTQAVIYNTMNYLAYNVAADLLQSKAVPSSSDIRKALLTKLRKHLSLFANSDINFNEIANNYTEYVESQIGRSNNLSNGLNSELQMVNIGRSRGCVFAPKAQTGHPYIIKSENILLFSYFRENTDTVIFFHNALQTKLLNLKPTYTDIEIDSNFIYLYYDKVEGANLRRYFIRTVQEYKAVANTETIQCSKISGKIYIVPGMPVYNQVVSPQTRQSFFIS
jgi:hypothetical protein